MLKKIRRLFVIKTRFEACLIIYALALGAIERGSAYLHQFPGWGGKMLFLAATGSVSPPPNISTCPRLTISASRLRSFG